MSNYVACRFAQGGIIMMSLMLVAGCAKEEAAEFQTLEKLSPGSLLEPDAARPILPAGVSLRSVHSKGLALTKVSEGWEPRIYNDPAGYCTIGYGHLIRKARCNGTEPSEFLGGITESRGTDLLKSDMAGAQITVMTSVDVLLTDVQYSALTDFVFNVGSSNFRNSTLLKHINAQRFEEVPTQLRRWTLADGKKYQGLVTRREGEIALFFEGQPVPKPLPNADEEVFSLDIRKGE